MEDAQVGNGRASHLKEDEVIPKHRLLDGSPR